jgi:serine/threonine-protein kinase
LPLSQAKEGSVVKLTISDGPGKTTVPADLVGLSLDEARAKIASAGLILTATTPISSSQDPGTVLSSNPAPGKSVTAGSSISLQISSGLAAVPNLVGLDKIAAETLLTQDGFLISVNTTVDNNQPTGVVLSQTPGTGSSVSIGSLVTITVNTGGPTTPSDGTSAPASGN